MSGPNFADLPITGSPVSDSPVSDLPFPIVSCVEEPGWHEVLGGDVDGFVAGAVAAAVGVLDAVPEGELSVAFVSDVAIAELNATYRDTPGATNVLAFPATEAMRAHVQGDVVIALQTMLRECSRRSRTASAHTTHLLVHGFLHLQGYDHMSGAERAVMEALERDALATLGVDDPYVMQA